MPDNKDRILILGLGNLLMGDEGVGIHAVRYMKQQKLPEFADIEDGGTGGFHLLSLIQAYPVVIIIDAAVGEDAPGTVRVIEPKFSKDFPKSLSSHDIGLKDLIDTASLLGNLPRFFLIIVSVKDWRDLKIELSPEVAAAIPEVYKKTTEVIKLLER